MMSKFKFLLVTFASILILTVFTNFSVADHFTCSYSCTDGSSGSLSSTTDATGYSCGESIEGAICCDFTCSSASHTTSTPCTPNWSCTSGLVCSATYSSTCSNSATGTETCTGGWSDSNNCGQTYTSNAPTCSIIRNTDGTSCGTVYGSWGTCSYSSTCAESGSRTRSVISCTCSGGDYQSSTTTETDTSGCSRTTTGNSCITPTGALGTCSGENCIPSTPTQVPNPTPTPGEPACTSTQPSKSINIGTGCQVTIASKGYNRDKGTEVGYGDTAYGDTNIYTELDASGRCSADLKLTNTWTVSGNKISIDSTGKKRDCFAWVFNCPPPTAYGYVISSSNCYILDYGQCSIDVYTTCPTLGIGTSLGEFTVRDTAASFFTIFTIGDCKTDQDCSAKGSGYKCANNKCTPNCSTVSNPKSLSVPATGQVCSLSSSQPDDWFKVTLPELSYLTATLTSPKDWDFWVCSADASNCEAQSIFRSPATASTTETSASSTRIAGDILIKVHRNSGDGSGSIEVKLGECVKNSDCGSGKVCDTTIYQCVQAACTKNDIPLSKSPNGERSTQCENSNKHIFGYCDIPNGKCLYTNPYDKCGNSNEYCSNSYCCEGALPLSNKDVDENGQVGDCVGTGTLAQPYLCTKT